MKRQWASRALAIVMATTFPAWAGAQGLDHAEGQQENMQQLREQYQHQRDQISGADRLDTRKNTEKNAQDQGSSFIDEPVDTMDAPDQQRDEPSSR